MNCIIIDDVQASIDAIAALIAKAPALTLVGTATDPVKGLHLLRETGAETLFLDMEMDEMSGLEVMKALDPAIKVVLCTAYAELGVLGYEFEVVDCLLKPIPLGRFMKSVNLLLRLPITTSTPGDNMFLKNSEGMWSKVDLDDIDYLEARDSNVILHSGEREMRVLHTLAYVESFLPTNLFTRVHRSFIVADKRIDGLKLSNLHLRNCETIIPLTSTYREVFWEKFKKIP